MIEAYQLRKSKAWVITGLVRDSQGTVYKSFTYYGETRGKAIKLFKAYIQEKGWQLL